MNGRTIRWIRRAARNSAADDPALPDRDAWERDRGALCLADGELPHAWPIYRAAHADEIGRRAGPKSGEMIEP